LTERAQRIEAARAAARDALRESAQARRESAKAGDEAREDLVRLAVSAVEGLETLAETAAGSLDALTPEAREAVGIAVQAAWERLESAGVSLDGEAGEAVDLSRHRVVKRLGPDGGGSDVVAEVVSRGILFKGARVRAAAVVARRTDGANRH
jgi:molecular chaperone GrpE (heat shock protein)